MADIKALLSQETAGLPNWAWVGVIAAGLVAAVVVPKLINGNANTGGTTPNTSTDSGTPASSGIGLATDPTTGLPYAVTGLVPSGGTAGDTSNSSGTTPPSPAQSTPGNTQALIATVRPKDGIPNYASWDNSHIGVPVWSSPGGPQVGYELWGSQFPVIGAPVAGPSNLQGSNAKNGSNVWYQVNYQGKTGYVNLWDLNGSPTVQQWPNSN